MLFIYQNLMRSIGKLIRPVPQEHRQAFYFELHRVNFKRTRVFSFVMTVFVVFTAVSYIGMAGLWEDKVLQQFLVADFSFLTVTVFYMIYFNIRKLKANTIRPFDQFLIYFLAAFLLVWSIAISTTEYSYSNGFPTFIFILFLLTAMVYFRFIVSLMLIMGSLVVLYVFIKLNYQIDTNIIQRYFATLPIALVSFLISRILFITKGDNFFSEIKISRMNSVLKQARDNLEDEVNRKTNELQQKNEEYKRAKEKAEESDRLKSAFLRNISHEVRTPINGIMGFAELLVKQNLPPDKQKRYLDYVVSNCRQLLTIVENIMTMSSLKAKTEKIFKTNVCLNLLLKESLEIHEPIAREKNIILEIELPLADEQSFLYTDANKLQQIITVLLNNAIKFTIEGSVKLGYRKENERIIIYISDTGIGINHDTKNKIFEPFWQHEQTITRNYGGTGLGLAIAKEYTNMLGGEIWAEPNSTRGSTFCLSVPDLNDDKMVHKKDSSENSVITDLNGNYKYNILIAEDEETNFLFLEEILSGLGYNLLHSITGKETIEYFKNHQIDAVLMDLKMPDMDGYAATREIKLINPDVPIIAQTSFSNSFEKQKALDAGCCAFLVKPLNREELICILDKCLKN